MRTALCGKQIVTLSVVEMMLSGHLKYNFKRGAESEKKTNANRGTLVETLDSWVFS